ncbi:MAG TPA: SAM-dependent methyltransferase [Polyangiaceae bacterium]|jgi:methyltransferase (TIGR00027 family)
MTAAWVAAARSFGVLLPERERLAEDPYGARFARTMPLFHRPRIARALFPRRAIVYMQLRTRAIDDVLREFVRGGGRQVVLLGAGFDCRALRFARELAGATVFEVDHPATQARKRAVLANDVGAKTEYVAWNFEERPVAELPAELAARGHDASKPTLTIWEGVTMYLRPRAIDDSVAAVATYSAPGSRLVFTYMERTLVENPTLRARAGAAIVGLVGEPFRFGFEPSELAGWLGARGFTLARDATMKELARELLGDEKLLSHEHGRHVATAVKV